MSQTWTRKQLLNVLGLLVLIAIIVPFLIYGVPALIGADASHVVLSGSMAPAIQAGDVVIVKDVRAETIEEGDIITFETPTGGLPTTHRVIGVSGTGADLRFETKGDANEDADPQLISPNVVNGKVILTIPLIGHVILFASTPLGLVVFLGLPFGILIVSEAWVFAKEASGDSDGGGSGSVLGKVPGATAAGLAAGSQDDTADASQQTGGRQAAPAATEPAAEGHDAESGSDSFTITPKDLQVSLVITGLFFAYAAWMFYQQWFVSERQTAIPVGVLVGTTAAFLILLGLYYGAEQQGEEDGRRPEEPGTRVASNGGQAYARMGSPAGRTVASKTAHGERSKPDAAGGIEATEPGAVQSMADLVAIANETRTPIEWRPWEESLELTPPAEVYVLEDAEGPVSDSEIGSTESRAGRNGEGAGEDDPHAGPGRDAGSGEIPPGEPAGSRSAQEESSDPAAGESGGEQADD